MLQTIVHGHLPLVRRFRRSRVPACRVRGFVTLSGVTGTVPAMMLAGGAWRLAGQAFGFPRGTLAMPGPGRADWCT
jgi:hypothetical protein